MNPAVRDRVILLALWMVNLAAGVQFLVVAPILPRVAEQLEVPEPLLGLLISSYAIAFGVTALLAGPVSDRFGRRVILLGGTLGMALALFAHGLAHSFEALLLARAAAGVSGGILSGSTVAFVGDWFPYERRGWANGILGSAFAAGQMLGVPAGAVLAEWSFALPFLVFGGLAALAFLLILRFVPQPDVELAESLSLSRAVRAYASLLAGSWTRAAIGAYVLMFSGVSLFVTYLPAWLEHRFDVGGREVATLFMVGGVSNLIAGPIAGSLSDRIGRKIPVILGAGGAGLIMMAMPWVVTAFWHAYVYFFVVMVFVAMRVSPLQSLVSSLVEPARRGSLMNLSFAFGQLGFAGGSALAGAMFTGPWGFAGNALAGGAMALAMAAVVGAFLPELTTEVAAGPQPARTVQ